jgi:hypothetical protein
MIPEAAAETKAIRPRMPRGTGKEIIIATTPALTLPTSVLTNRSTE